jgi:oxygen-independent coproporphyrinogen-3 oxidase
VDALLREIAFYGQNYEEQYGKKQEIETVYFGGGTPSVIGAERLTILLQEIRKDFALNTDAEITVEINPATMDEKGLQTLKENGVNRLSIGLQSANDTELRLLGRVHSYDDFLKIYQFARKVGFKNLNVDLISSLPGQTIDSYLYNLQQVIALQPEHISSYSLIVEEGTPFYEIYGDHPELLPDEDTDREMYHLTKTKLQEMGYERYEISNYAKPGFASKHNSGYWKRTPYLGVGLGAASFDNHKRKKNVSDLKTYLRVWNDQNSDILSEGCEEIEILTLEDEMAEFMYLGLRMSEGVARKDFEENFGKPIQQVYGGVLEQLKRQKLLEEDLNGERIRLTDFGMDVSNYVFEKFLLS